MYNSEKNKEIISGIECQVSGCKYHFGISGCTAPFINIKNKNSFFATGTQCHTYEEKK